MDKIKEEKDNVTAESTGKKGNKKLIIAAAGIVAVIVVVGIVAVTTGLFSGSGGGKKDDIASNAALKSDEYKAVVEYNQYLGDLTDEEMETAIDSSEDSAYDAPKKVEEICKKYNLKYATNMTAFETYEDVEKALKEKNLTGLLSDDLTQALKNTMKDYEGGYTYDDGNLYLEIEQSNQSEGSSIALISLGISPKGTFPGKAYSLEAEAEEEKTEPDMDTVKRFNYKPKSGGNFACMTDESTGIAFGQVGDYYVSFDITKDQTEEESNKLDQEAASIDKKVQKETGLENLDALDEKVNSGLETAWEKEQKAMQEAVDNDDKDKYEAIRKKYTKASEKEIALYKECIAELEKYDKAIAVSETDMQEYLDKFDFSKFV